MTTQTSADTTTVLCVRCGNPIGLFLPASSPYCISCLCDNQDRASLAKYDAWWWSDERWAQMDGISPLQLSPETKAFLAHTRHDVAAEQYRWEKQLMAESGIGSKYVSEYRAARQGMVWA